MFAKFKINIEDVRRINREAAALRRFSALEEKDAVTSEIKLLFENDRGIIDGEKLKTEYFTKYKKYQTIWIFGKETSSIPKNRKF